jgi:steroid 5-alpha reductase family enzyme
MEKICTASKGLPKAFSICLLSYVLALLAAILVGRALNTLHPILIAFWADIAATLVIYVFSRLFHNSSFYDPYWSVAPLAIVVYWALMAMPDTGIGIRQMIIIILVLVWGLRLTLNWATQWKGLQHEDWRYTDYRNKNKRWFWLIDLFGIELMPTLIVFLGCLCLYPVLTSGNTPFGVWDILAVPVTLGAIVIETAADEQLKRFIRQPDSAEGIMQRGLWAYSRHPNYFGEILFWWGLYLFALAANPLFWWTIMGPLIITLLFLVISIPLMDRRSLDRRPGYAQHIKKISALIPWFPRN